MLDAPARPSGGSAQTKPRRSRVPRENPTALERAYARLAEVEVKRLQATFRSLDSKWNGKEHDQAEGMVLSLIRQGVPNAQIRAMYGVGGYMIERLKAVLTSGIDTLHTRRSRSAPKHAFSEDDIAFFQNVCRGWDLEDAFPCQHRRPRQYLVELGITWTKLWERYSDAAEAAGRRVIQYCRFTQFRQYYFPEIHLSRAKVNECDACVRIDVELLRRDLSDHDRSELEIEKRIHLDAAITQRQAMSPFVKEYVARYAPGQSVPAEVISDHAEIPLEACAVQHPNVPVMQIQIEDFGGGLPLPNYGNRRPSADYFNSNLMLHNFVVADLTSGENNVFVYDERAQGKGADALCNLRLFQHLRLRQQYRQASNEAPENTHTLLLILDNCVGQNKSRVVFMFYAMLSIVFYKKVVLLFLLPGHSHNSADRVVGWCKRNLKGKNLYDPGEVVAQMNTTPAIKAEFLDHRTGTGPFFVGWKALLSKYFESMPDGYTANYFYEIDAGVVTTRHLVTTADQNADTFSIIGNGDAGSIRKALLGDLFGSEHDLDTVTMENVQLARQAPLSLTTKKVKSLSLKYFSIPPQYLAYYPVDPASTPEPNETTCGSEQTNSNDETPGGKRKVAVGVPPQSKKRVGRPPKLPRHLTKSPSILTFFSPVKTG